MKRLLVLILTISFAQSAFAMRCGNLLVAKGDYQIDVVERCGRPDLVSERTEYRYVELQYHRNSIRQGRQVPVHIEEWTYNFGPRRLMRLLKFENGQLISIRTLSYGYRKRFSQD